MICRSCGSKNLTLFLDLGTSPPSNSLVPFDKLSEQEEYYPLRTLVCEQCMLVQTEDFVVASEMFTPDYAYFSSFSSTWIEHAKQFVNDMMSRCSLNKSSFVVEIASNDGYLLQYFKRKKIP